MALAQFLQNMIETLDLMLGFEPWFFERVAAELGASSALHGLRLNYSCADGGILYGDVRRGTPWTIQRAAGENGRTLHRVAIARAWY